MTDRTRQIVVYSLCGAGLLWAALNFDSGKKPTTSGSPEPVSTMAGAAEEVITTPAARLDSATAARLERLPWAGDPFRLKVEKRVEKPRVFQPPVEIGPGWLLGGIFYNESAPSAVVNNKSVVIGDNVNGAMVREISRTRVVLEHEGKTIALTMAQPKG